MTRVCLRRGYVVSKEHNDGFALLKSEMFVKSRSDKKVATAEEEE